MPTRCCSSGSRNIASAYILSYAGDRLTKLHLLKEGEDLHDDLEDAIKLWEPLRQETISKLNVLADKVDEVCKATTSEEKIFNQLPIQETQKQMNDDHSATIRVINIISGIRVVVEKIAHLTPDISENKIKQMYKILLSTSPNAIAFIADKLSEYALDVAEISESVAEQGNNVDDYGKGVKKLGKIAVTMGGVVGWVKAKDAGENIENVGKTFSWLGDLVEDCGELLASGMAKVSEVVKVAAGTLSSTPDNVMLSITLFPINVMECLDGNLEGDTETKAARVFREMASMHEKQMKKILETVD